MRCPHCKQNIRVQGRFCPKCGEQIFGAPVRRQEPPPSTPSEPAPPAWSGPPPPSQPPQPAPPDLSDWSAAASQQPEFFDEDIIDITLDEGEAPAEAHEEAVGKTCPYCRFPIKSAEDVVVCSACGVPHHRDCWQENGGCTTYGCRGAPGVAAAGTVPAPGAHPATSGPVGDLVTQLLVTEVNGSATNALVCSILGIIPCCLLSIVGFFWGISVLSSISRLGIHAPGAYKKAIAAVILGILIPLFWFLCVLAGVPGSVGQH